MKAMQHQVNQRATHHLQGAGENNLLPSQTINRDHTEEALTSATTASSLPLPLNNKSTCMHLSQKLNWNEMLLSP